MTLKAALVFLTAAVAGCATIHSKSTSSIDKGAGHRVAATDSGYGYLMLTTPDLDGAAKLKAECQGRVSGVSTTLSSRNWFGIVQTYEEQIEGWCQ